MTEQDFRDIEARLENWRRGVAYLKGGAASCGSAEKFYRCPSDRFKVVSGVMVDMGDAWVIEQAWRTIMQPWAKWMIKWHYIFKAAPHAVMRQLQRRAHHGIRRDRYDHELRVAVGLLKINVDTRISRSYISRQQFESTESGVSSSQMAALSRQEEMKPAAAR
ncbi:MAG TPA: hypothetical protein VGK09_08300 [Rhodocyclaceae bacterium]|jgi:hypothetical protein